MCASMHMCTYVLVRVSERELLCWKKNVVDMCKYIHFIVNKYGNEIIVLIIV